MELNLNLLIALAFLLLMLPVVPLVWFVVLHLRKTCELFCELALRLDGSVTGLPFGLVYQLGNPRIRVFALQGSIQYRARIRLRVDPGILVSRRISRLKFIDALHDSPSRKPFLFRSAVDEKHGFRAKDARWMRELFPSDLLARLSTTNRIRRIEIRRRNVKGTILLWGNAAEEHEKASDAVDVLNEVTLSLSRSSLAVAT